MAWWDSHGGLKGRAARLEASRLGAPSASSCTSAATAALRPERGQGGGERGGHGTRDIWPSGKEMDSREKGGAGGVRRKGAKGQQVAVADREEWRWGHSRARMMTRYMGRRHGGNMGKGNNHETGRDVGRDRERTEDMNGGGRKRRERAAGTGSWVHTLLPISTYGSLGALL